uniref:NADH:ubiquinone reductase (H(+)-translocating) n=1 Tax=Macrotrachela quadricornifera TaxID=104788 RepID=J7KI20_9BILA|nr:NADH dehydrogenase subunit 5 [Macrotrachela quadricornifera]
MLKVVMFIGAVFLLFVVLLMIIFILSNNSMMINSLKIFNMGFFSGFELILSIWSVMFMLMVLLISSSVMMLSFSYFSGLWVSNFVFLYFSFIVSMLWLTLNNNFYWMMFGWDGLGVVSFLLIVYYMNHESINNGLFTLFQNRIGDLFFVLFMVGMIDFFMFNLMWMKWGMIFLILGSSVKSAQFPFNSWLLSAMSAPTPISSLVHSSTLVVAGVYILLQYSYSLGENLDYLKYISFISLFISSFGLLNEMDMKKLIAYSTMNHVSLMMFMLSYKLFKVTYFHLNVHAMFKSLMFMCFGFVMLSSYHSQDKRLVFMGNLNPIIKMIYYYSCLCLAGLPFLSAFFSKDLIIEKFMENNVEIYFIIMLLMFLSLSIYYSMKLLSLTKYMNSYMMMEKSFLGLCGLILMTLVMVLFINIFISLIFSLTFELVSFKLSIYIGVMLFFILSLMTNLNFKLVNYDKMINFKESWFINMFSFDKYVYWNFFLMLEFLGNMNKNKMIVLMNWWIMILIIVLFYSESF